MQNQFKIFSKSLSQKLKNKSLLKEDDVRYSLFYALLKSKYCPHYIIRMEFPHPIFKQSEIDTIIKRPRKSIAFEFKYDKKNKGAMNRPERAGMIFKDIFRLARLPNNYSSYFVYLTDDVMRTYFKNHRNCYGEFFDMRYDCCLLIDRNFISKRPDSFKAKTRGLYKSCNLRLVFKRTLLKKCFLRIYKIEKANAA